MDLGATTKSLRSIPQADDFAIDFNAFSPSHDQNLNGGDFPAGASHVDDPNVFHTPNRETMVDVGNFRHFFGDHRNIRNGVFNIRLMGLYI